MSDILPAQLAGYRIHLVGAKGTGVCALAELLVGAGAVVSGSDVDDVFYTDEILEALGVPVRPFSADAIDRAIQLVIHSAAYNPSTHPELLAAASLGIPVITYPQALGALSARRNSSGISGVHGKTTTTALSGVLAGALGLRTAVLAGSAVGAFGGRSTMTLGTEQLIAETCEYRRHFLAFRPRRIVITSVEPDHQDYYPDYDAISAAFVEYACSLPLGGSVIYCADDRGAVDVWQRAVTTRPDLRGVPYGFSAEGPFRIDAYRTGDGYASFRLDAWDQSWQLHVPGRHVVLDATAALALCTTILEETEARQPRPEELRAMAEALEGFSGSRRRSEIVGEAAGVLVMDDYGHHPTAIRTTLAGLRQFYPGRRLVVDFMSHTASRTRALLDDFASSFADADLVVLHRIYPSAREAPDPEMTGQLLFSKVVAAGAQAVYFDEPVDAVPWLLEELKPGDLFITMGAGDNWKVGVATLDGLGRV